MLSKSLKEQMPLFSEDHNSGWRLTCWWRTFAWKYSKAWEVPAQSRSASALFCAQVVISASVHPFTDSFTGIPKTRWAFSYPKRLSPTVCRRPSAKRAVAASSICCTSSAQIKGSAGLAHLDHTVPLGGLRISAQIKCEGTVFTRFVAASLDVLILSKSLPDLWFIGFRALGLDVWLLTDGNRARFQVQGKSRTKGASKCLREVLIPLHL